MEKKRNILTLLLAFCMMASLAGPAFALEYAFDGAEGLAYHRSRERRGHWAQDGDGGGRSG